MDVCMPVCMHNFMSMLASFDWGVWGHVPPGNFLNFEIVSEAILEQTSPRVFKKKKV